MSDDLKSRSDLWICERKVNIADFVGATSYEYFVPIKQFEPQEPIPTPTLDAEKLKAEVFAAIDVFQDMVGWQPHESRNALVVEIREAVMKCMDQITIN